MKKTLFILLPFLICTSLFSQSEKDSLILEIDKYFNMGAYFYEELDRISTNFAYCLPHINENYWENVKKYQFNNAIQKVQPELLKVANERLDLQQLKTIVQSLNSEEGPSEEIWSIIAPISWRLGSFIRALITQKLYNDLTYKNLIPKLEDHTNCKKLKNGSFLNISPNRKDTVYISRIGKQQIEKFNADQSVFNVKWVNDNTYELILTESNNAYFNDSKSDHQRLVAEIYEVTDKFYRCYYYDYIYEYQYYGFVTIYFTEESQKTD